MQDHTGIFIVLEGSDGSGKATQFNLLKERLEAVGYDVAVFDFPQYDKPSSHFVKRYLNGDYGPAADINPYTASMFYALDRFEAATDIRQALSEGKVVLSNRYAGSNMAHQGSKFTSAAEQRGFFVWAESMEFQLLGIPRPHLSIYLRVPAELSYKLIAKKAARSYTDSKRDQHEADIEHLRAAVKTFDLLCQLFPRDFHAIDCTDGEQMLSIPTINDRVWQHLQPLLSDIPKHKPHSKTVSLNSPITSGPTSSSDLKIVNFDTDTQAQPLKIKLNGLSLLAARNIAAAEGIDAQLVLSKKTEVYEPKLHSQQLQKRYRELMSEIAARHQLMLKVMPKANNMSVKSADIMLAAAPLAHFCDIEVRGPAAAVQKLIAYTASSNLAELAKVSQSLYSLARAKRPEEFRTFSSHTQKQAAAGTSGLIDKLPQKIGSPDNQLQLTSAMPRNEFELINNELYKNSSLAISEVVSAADSLKYGQKVKLLNEFLKEVESKLSAVQEINYEWEILASGITFNYLLQNGLIGRVVLQAATPRYGYEVPEILSEAGIEDLFTDCFDDSLGLFSELQSGGNESEAQYGVLMGHRLRWRASMNFSKILKLKALSRESDCPAEAKSILEAMQQAISEVHPLIGEQLAAMCLQKLPNPPVARPKSSRPSKRQRNRTRKPTKN